MSTTAQRLALTDAPGSVSRAPHLVADDVTPVVLGHCGHYVADEAPAGMVECLEPFLEPYRAER